MLDVDNIFIIHYSLLSERKIFLQSLLNKSNLQAEWVENEPSNIADFYEFSVNEWNKKIEPFNYGTQVLPRNLKKSELSLAYKHIQVFKKIVDNNINNSLIFEDDVLLINNFKENFNKNLLNTPKDWDFIFIGNGCNLKIPKEKLKKGIIAYEKTGPATRCCDSYVVSLAAAKKIYERLIKKITLPIDFELNFHIEMCKLKTYWWEPHIVMQGSQFGLFKSETQNDKNIS